MQIVSNGDNLHAMSNPVFLGETKKNTALIMKDRHVLSKYDLVQVWKKRKKSGVLILSLNKGNYLYFFLFLFLEPKIIVSLKNIKDNMSV